MDPCVMSFTIAGVMAFMTMARTVFANTLPGKLSDDEMAMLVHRTRGYDISGGLIGVVVGAATGFGFWAACHVGADLWDRAMPAHVLLYRMTGGELSNTIYALPAFFIGMMAAYWGHVLAIRLLFGSDGLFAWQIVSNHKAGFDSHRLMKVLSVLFVVGSLVGTALLMDYYVRAEEDRFVTNDLLSFGEKSHSYAEVKMIAQTSHVRAPSGGEPERHQLHVFFTDGTVWTAEPAEKYQPLVEFLTKKTGKKLVTARHIAELPNK